MEGGTKDLSFGMPWLIPFDNFLTVKGLKRWSCFPPVTFRDANRTTSANPMQSARLHLQGGIEVAVLDSENQRIGILNEIGASLAVRKAP